MKRFIPNWFSHYRERRYARERENALRILGLTERDLRYLDDEKIRLITRAGMDPMKLGPYIAELTYQGLSALGGSNLLLDLSPKQRLKRARDILNTKALSPTEFNELLALLAAYRLSVYEYADTKTQTIQSKKPYRPLRQRAKRR